jgi:hypothetical protein
MQKIIRMIELIEPLKNASFYTDKKVKGLSYHNRCYIFNFHIEQSSFMNNDEVLYLPYSE